MSDEKQQEQPDATNVYVLNISVISAKDLPDLDFGSKDKTDPVCKVSFKDPATGCQYVWRTEEIFDELNPVWNESNSWALFFDPPNDLPIEVEIFDIDSFTSVDKVGKVILKLADIDGKPKVLKGKKCKKTTTITLAAKKQRLIMVPENFVKNVNERLKVDKEEDVEYATVDDVNNKLEKYAKLDKMNGLQSTVQKIQADNILNVATYAKKKEVEQSYVKNERLKELEERMERMQKEYEAKLSELGNELRDKVGGITNKLDGIKNVLND